MHVVAFPFVVCGWEERKEREKRENDHVFAFCWSSGCPDSRIAPRQVASGLRKNGCPDDSMDR